MTTEDIFLEEQEEERKKAKNPHFTQVYPEGWDGMMTMMAENANAARLFAFIANHMDPNGGVLVASQKVLAEALDVAEITIRRASAWLEERKHLVRVRVGTSVYAYALNPNEVWKSFHESKKYAVFTTRTLVSKSDEFNRTVDRRIKTMLKEPRQEALPEMTVQDLGQVLKGNTPSVKKRARSGKVAEAVQTDAFEDYLAEAIAAE